MSRQIRPVALCVFRNEGRIFVEERVEPGKASLYRPPGGMIKFGQRSKDCIVREIREELQAEVKDLRHVGTIENIFEYEGELGHEIVLFMKPSL